MLIKLCSIILVITAKLSTQEPLTWREAFNKCKNNNGYLDSDIADKDYGPSKLYDMSQSSTWIGSVELLSKWLEILGCYVIDDPASGINHYVKTIANCEMECRDFEFFAYRTGENSVCKCIPKLPNRYTDANNCEKGSYRYLIVYGRYKHSTLFETEKENCMYISCSTPPTTLTGPVVANCMSHQAHGVCANEIAVNNWNLDRHESLQYCITKQHTYFVNNFRTRCSLIAAPSWTNYFRQQVSFYYDFHSQKGEIKGHQLIKCAAKRWDVTNSSWTKTYIDCNRTLPYYQCKKDSQYHAGHDLRSTAKEESDKTTEIGRYESTLFLKSTVLSTRTKTRGSTNNAITTSVIKRTTDLVTTKVVKISTRKEIRQDVIIGSVVGGMTVIVGVSILLLVCKFRSYGIFSKKTDHSVIEFSKETREGSDQSIPKKKQPHVENVKGELEIQKAKDTYLEVIKPHKTERMNTLYSEVNKTRKFSPDIRETDDNYSEFTEGEYDRLNNFDRRILEKDSNMYDSNLRIRNYQDPMYYTTLHESRFESEDVYDHSFTNVNIDSNYDCSSSVAQTHMKENDVYDKSV